MNKKKELFSGVKGLKSGKSVYIDEISNEALKSGYGELQGPLVHLFNIIFRSGGYPNIWRDGFIVPIHKKNDIMNANNYSGIIISSSVAKLFLRIVTRRIEEFMKTSGRWSVNQFGFRSDHRTEDSLFMINTIFDSYVIHQNKPLFVAFVDFSKFFDKINRTHLLYKLLKCGITGRVYDIVKSMYKDIGYRVRVNNHLSPRFTGSLGVKQGCCLSPTLSNIFQNDLHVLFKDSACDPVKLGTKYLNSLSWADDLFLVSTTRDGLQKCLDKLRSYCIKWGLEVNSDKTKTMIFSKQKRTMGQPIKYGESNLENVDSFEYLGFKLKYNTAVSHLMADRASKARRVNHMVMQAISTNDKNISPRLSLN